MSKRKAITDLTSVAAQWGSFQYAMEEQLAFNNLPFGAVITVDAQPRTPNGRPRHFHVYRAAAQVEPNPSVVNIEISSNSFVCAYSALTWEEEFELLARGWAIPERSDNGDENWWKGFTGATSAAASAFALTEGLKILGVLPNDFNIRSAEFFDVSSSFEGHSVDPSPLKAVLRDLAATP